MKQAKATLSSHDNVLNCSMERVLKATNMIEKNAAMETARIAKTGIDKVNEDLEYLQKKLMRHLEKKTCNVYIKCSSTRINKFIYKTNYFF